MLVTAARGDFASRSFRGARGDRCWSCVGGAREGDGDGDGDGGRGRSREAGNDEVGDVSADAGDDIDGDDAAADRRVLLARICCFSRAFGEIFFLNSLETGVASEICEKVTVIERSLIASRWTALEGDRTKRARYASISAARSAWAKKTRVSFGSR